MMVLSVLPDVTNQAGNVTLDLRTRETPVGQSTSHTYTLETATLKKDVRVSGRLVRVRFEGNDTSGTTDTYMRLGAPIFDAVPTGQR